MSFSIYEALKEMMEFYSPHPTRVLAKTALMLLADKFTKTEDHALIDKTLATLKLVLGYKASPEPQSIYYPNATDEQMRDFLNDANALLAKAHALFHPNQ